MSMSSSDWSRERRTAIALKAKLLDVLDALDKLGDRLAVDHSLKVEQISAHTMRSIEIANTLIGAATMTWDDDNADRLGE